MLAKEPKGCMRSIGPGVRPLVIQLGPYLLHVSSQDTLPDWISRIYNGH